MAAVARRRFATPLAEILVSRILDRGPLTFAEYMEACLYHPEHGYYSKAEAEPFADYYTSAAVHPVFGRLIARQLAEMWSVCGQPSPFIVAEAGAGAGWLAGQVLDFAARALPEFYHALRYVAVESSTARREAAGRRLAQHAQSSRATIAAGLPGRIPAGCILSNELFDAMPVHRVVVEHGELREIYVAWDGERFSEQLGPLSTPAIAAYFAEQGVELRERQQAEVNLAACRWMEDAGKRLALGFVLTIDYGHAAAELYDERHLRGTLLAYHQHRASEDFYAAPGEHDLTAHVNFTALELCGARAGLETLGRVSQAQLLLALGQANEFADLYDPGQTEADRVRARLKLKTLIFPEGMGETFQVLIQHKGSGHPVLTGLAPVWPPKKKSQAGESGAASRCGKTESGLAG